MFLWVPLELHATNASIMSMLEEQDILVTPKEGGNEKKYSPTPPTIRRMCPFSSHRKATSPKDTSAYLPNTQYCTCRHGRFLLSSRETTDVPVMLRAALEWLGVFNLGHL